MMKLLVVLAALSVLGNAADFFPWAVAPITAHTTVAGRNAPQEKVPSDAVTFHVMGMKKTASGAT